MVAYDNPPRQSVLRMQPHAVYIEAPDLVVGSFPIGLPVLGRKFALCLPNASGNPLASVRSGKSGSADWNLTGPVFRVNGLRIEREY